MKRSNPSTVAGGGEMNRDTSSVESVANSDAASLRRSSRNVTSEPASVGRPVRQSIADGFDSGADAVETTGSRCGWYRILSMALPHPLPRAPDDVVAIRCPPHDVAAVRGRTPHDVVAVRSAPDDVVAVPGAPDDVVADHGAPDNVVTVERAPNDVVAVQARAPHDVCAVDLA